MLTLKKSVCGSVALGAAVAVAMAMPDTGSEAKTEARKTSPKVVALLDKVASAYKGLRTLSGTVVTETNDGRPPTRMTFFLEKPNKMRLYEEGPNGKLLVVADGVDLWWANDPVKPSAAARFRREQADPHGYRYYLYGLPTGLRQFFDPRPELFTSSSRDVVHPTMLPSVESDGATYQVVEMAAVDPAPAVTRLYIGSDSLIHRWQRAKSFESGNAVATVSRLENVKVNAPAPAGTYDYTPPAGEKVFKGLPYKGNVLPLGSKAPDFTLPNPKGGEVQLGKLLAQKKVVLLHFFSVLCKPCHSEIRQVQQFVNKLGDDRLAFVLIDEHETPEMVNEFTTKHNFTATVGISDKPHFTSNGVQKVERPSMMDIYGVTLLPATYLIDSDGTVRYYCFGFNEDEVRAVVEKLGMGSAKQKSASTPKGAAAATPDVAKTPPASEPADSGPVSVQVSGPKTVPASGEFTIEVRLAVDGNYHIYPPSKDKTTIGTEVVVKAPPGFVVGKARYPKAEIGPSGGDDVEMYRGTVVVRVPVKATKARAGTHAFTLVTRYQACTESSCLAPQKTTSTIKLTVAP